MSVIQRYHVYLVRHKDYWLRIVLHRGRKRDHMQFLRTIGTNIAFLGSLPMHIKYDVDVMGTRRVDGFTVISCVHAKQMITCVPQDKPLEQRQREFVDNIRSLQEAILCSAS